jgi:transcriptional regulator with XRE-family HTH domain
MSAIATHTPVTDESFGQRMRRERERRQIALASIAENSKISVSLFEDLERDTVSRWPSGIFRRAFIRAYAQAVGLDVDATTREFLEHFPDPHDPDPASKPALPAPPSTSMPALRLTLADTGGAFSSGGLLQTARIRGKAVACDAAIVCLVGLAMYLALGMFWMPLSIALAGYYAAGILLLGNTPGVCLCAPAARSKTAANGRKIGPRIRSLAASIIAAVGRTSRVGSALHHEDRRLPEAHVHDLPAGL